VTLVGSHARGTAREDSDVDLVVLTPNPGFFRENADLIDTIKWDEIPANPVKWQDEDYGLLASRRLILEPNHNPRLGGSHS